MSYPYKKTAAAARRWVLGALTTEYQHWNQLCEASRAGLTDDGELPWRVAKSWLAIARRECTALGEVEVSPQGTLARLTEQGERAKVAEFMLAPITRDEEDGPSPAEWDNIRRDRLAGNRCPECGRTLQGGKCVTCGWEG